MDNITGTEERDPGFRDLIHQHIHFISRQCRRLVQRKSGGYLRGELNLENEADVLFNRVIDKLTAHDYRVLRRFEGRSKITTYFTAVISRTAVDLIRERTGRGNPDAASPPAGTIPGTPGSPVVNGFPSGRDGEVVVPDRDNIPEMVVMGENREEKIKSALSEMAAGLRGEEKLLLRMKFPMEAGREPMGTSRIAGVLGISEKGVYHRIHRLIRKCRSILEKAGITEEEFIRAEFKGFFRQDKWRE